MDNQLSRHQCQVHGHIHDPAEGGPAQGVAPATAFTGRLTFDPAVLEVKGVDEGPVLSGAMLRVGASNFRKAQDRLEALLKEHDRLEKEL